MTTPFNPDIHLKKNRSEVTQIQNIVQRLNQTLTRDEVVQSTTDSLRRFLQVDRVVLYYFYKAWEGRVTFESLSQDKFSILGSTGPDECFNGEYAQMYLQGRVRAIANIETEAIAPCHRDFLKNIGVQANLVIPILIKNEQPDDKTRLWGLLVAHHCQGSKEWLTADIERMQQGALALSESSAIRAVS